MDGKSAFALLGELPQVSRGGKIKIFPSLGDI